jgi:hypothetical protein
VKEASVTGLELVNQNNARHYSSQQVVLLLSAPFGPQFPSFFQPVPPFTELNLKNAISLSPLGLRESLLNENIIMFLLLVA